MANAAESSDTSMQIRKNKRGQIAVEQHMQRGSSHALFLVALPLQRQQLDLLHSKPQPLRWWPALRAATN